jgi:hypothetical protein
MGMDLHGHNPTAPEGEYFRASIWTWPSLVKVITALCPEETSNCKNWDTMRAMGLTASKHSGLRKHSNGNFDLAR